jgi:hypothetical protein
MPSHQYEPLSSGDNTLEDCDTGGSDRHLHRFSASPWTRFCNALRVVLFLEIVHAVLLTTGYFVFYHRSPPGTKGKAPGCSELPASLRSLAPLGINPILDLGDASPLTQTYVSLHEYTIPHTLSDGNLTFLRNTLSPDYYFNLTFLHHHGLVSLPQQSDLTTILDLPVTSIPTVPYHSVYKISVFHHLHCLSRIQRWIITHPPFATYNTTEFDQVYPLVASQSTESLETLDQMPATSHVLHCLDWIRQVIMCDADLRISLTNTDSKYLELGGERLRMCRDWEAIASWVDGHR